MGRSLAGRVLAGFALAIAAPCAAHAADRWDAPGILRRLGVERGIIAVVDDPELALDIARRGELLVYAQLSDAAAVERAREAAEDAGLDATRFQAAAGPPSRLYLVEDIADGLVSAGSGSGVSEGEALRVLRPRAKALLGEREVTKPVPAGVDDWTHPYHGPDNNPLSRDRVIRAPYMTRFLANPRYGPAPQVAIASAGRVFKAFGNVAWHEREEAFLNTLAAFNGYNGTLLWKRKLPEGMMVHRNTFIATPELLYVGDHESCKLIDAATGATRDEIRPPVDLAGGTFWKWMGLEDGLLCALVGEEELRDPEVRWRRTEHGWPWDAISKGYNMPEHPWGFGKNILAIDPATRKILWHHREEEPADSRAVAMRGGRLFAFRFGSYLTALDTKTGSVLWRKTPANDPGLFQTIGALNPRQGWETNWRTAAYLKASDQALYFAGPQMGKLLALSTEDGRILWQDPYDNFQLVLREDGLYGIGGGRWGENISRRFDPLTGRVLAELPAGRRACTRPTATSDSILFRAMGGSVRFDPESVRPRWISPMRPQCHDGVTIAGGLLYWWPYACDCQLTLYGITCLGSAGDFDFTPGEIEPQRFVRSARLEPTATTPASPGDWPLFRRDAEGRATTPVEVPERTRVLWTARPSQLAGTRPTPPVAAGGLVLLGGQDGVVRALDASSGAERWKVRTGGSVRLPPAVWKGRAIAGSSDGWVYALDLTSGRELWRFRAAPAERLIPAYGRLISTWPVTSGVLIERDTAYVAAGIVNYDGTYVYALDPATGAVRWRNDTSGHLDPEARTGVSAQGHLLLREGKLYLAGGNAVSPGVYAAADGRCLNDPAPLARCESTSPRGWELYAIGDHVIACGMPWWADPEIPVYDHTVTRKIFHASAGGRGTPGRDILWVDAKEILCLPPVSKDVLNASVSSERIPQHIIQGWGRIEAKLEPFWRKGADAAGEAIAVAPNAVVVAEPSRVVAWSLADGSELWAHDLPGRPVPWGLAVDSAGRVVVTLTDGRVVAIGRDT